MEQLLNGRFEYEVPHLLLSETEVALTLDEGQNFRGELNIGAEDGRRVKGIVTTDHQRIILAKNQFQGTASTIEYGVDTSGLKAGDEICETSPSAAIWRNAACGYTSRLRERQ